MDTKAIVDQLIAKQHRGCTRWRFDAENGLVVGSKGCPELTPDEAEAIAFYVPPRAKRGPTGGELIRESHFFEHRGLRCEVYKDGGSHYWKGHHRDNTASPIWHGEVTATNRAQAEADIKAAVDRWHKAQDSRDSLASRP